MSFRVEKLGEAHRVEDFDCGVDEQNHYLQEVAWQNMQLGYGVTYVAVDETSGNVTGFYALASGHVEFENLPEDFQSTEGLPRYPAPTVLLGQLGVDLSAQGRGLGKALLAHSIEKAVQVSEVVGAVAVEVHTGSEKARSFYERYGFVQMQDSPDHLFLSMEVARSLTEGPGDE
jgi:GNAT superfamily N-acetyltransferase